MIMYSVGFRIMTTVTRHHVVAKVLKLFDDGYCCSLGTRRPQNFENFSTEAREYERKMEWE